MPSSVIANFDYNAEQARLTVTFVTGRVYCYFLVPPDCVTRFTNARSKGAFFNKYIRDKYPCREAATRVA